MKTCRYCKFSEVRRDDYGAVRNYCILGNNQKTVGDSETCEDFQYMQISLKFDWGIGWGADLQYGY